MPSRKRKKKKVYKPPKRTGPPLTQHQRAERRLHIAAHVEKHHSIAAACRKFKVGDALVRTSCKEHGVPLPIFPANDYLGVKTLDILAAIIHSEKGETLTSIGKRFDISRSRVSAVFVAAADRKIPLGKWIRPAKRLD